MANNFLPEQITQNIILLYINVPPNFISYQIQFYIKHLYEN